MAQLEFDEGLGKQLEAMYRRRDVIRRRLVMNALSAQPGEDVVDVGCRSRGPRRCPPDWNTF
jgi:hypothetical protein